MIIVLMEMRKTIYRIFNFNSFILLVMITLTIGACKSSDQCIQTPKQNNLAVGKSGPRKIYVPEYYTYRRGKYEFVKGHYRWVLFPKAYAKRSMKGYTTKPERASLR